MTKIPLTPPSGFRDFTPKESNARAHAMHTIAKIYQSFGFQRIMTAACENLSVLQGKGGGQENERLIFKILKRGEALQEAITQVPEKDLDVLADMGLRFDLTIPLARYYSRFRNELPHPFKVFNMGSVWRAERSQKGRFREFTQCDVDILGSKEIGAELDIIAALASVFKNFGLNEIQFHCNDRRLLDALGKKANIDPTVWNEVTTILDKMDKIGVDAVKTEIAEKISTAQIQILESYLFKKDNNTLAAWKNLEPEIVANLTTLAQLLQSSLGLHLDFNPTLVRGLDYYTGTIFEIRHPSLPYSLGGGGRYDRLLEGFGGEKVPACGGSIGFERLLLLLEEKTNALQNVQQTQIFFPLFSAELRGKIMSLAQELRERGLCCDVYPDITKLKNQFKYASDQKIPFVAIFGEDEQRNNTIKIKHMLSGQEETLTLDKFVKKMETLCQS